MTALAAGRPRVARSLFGWIVALVVSVALNMTLFGLMPGLIQRIPAVPDKLEALKNIRVIRMKKQETPPRKKQPPEITKPKPIKQVTRKLTTQVKQQRVNMKPKLDFELNPRLPAAPMDLAMPVLENFSMDVPQLKSVYDVAELDSALIPLVRIPSMYPARAKRRGIQGFVTVEFMVTKEGLVKDIVVVEAQPEKVFENSVLTSVSQWKFKPPTVEGIPVATRARTTMKFKLEED